VTEMSFNELELELSILKVAHDIFTGKGPEDALSSMQPVIDMYAERIRDIENEIFERNVLV
jgi:predicted RNase H-like HicB family nuclease